MLTLLGIGAGVLVVIILVAVAIRIHAGRSNGGRGAGATVGGVCGRRGSNRGCTESATNRVVVTTIEEELDLDHNAQRLMLLDGTMRSTGSNGKDIGGFHDSGRINYVWKYALRIMKLHSNTNG